MTVFIISLSLPHNIVVQNDTIKCTIIGKLLIMTIQRANKNLKLISIKIPNLPFQQVDWREVLPPSLTFQQFKEEVKDIKAGFKSKFSQKEFKKHLSIQTRESPV